MENSYIAGSLTANIASKRNGTKKNEKEIWYVEPKIFVIIIIVPYLLK